jgi:hypothetical protein
MGWIAFWRAGRRGDAAGGGGGTTLTGLVLRCVVAGGVGFLCLLSVWVGWKLVRADVEARVYRDRLAELASDYRALRDDYNAAVRKTAVTELVVHEGELWVRVRNAAGTVSLMKTPVDAEKEVFADFIVADGRLWVRRVYDQSTPPERGFVVDDELGAVEWDAGDPTMVGKTVYRPLGEGRWVVRVTGNGALGLDRIGDVPAAGVESLRDEASPELARGVELRDFDEWMNEIASDTETINGGDVVRALFGSGKGRE